MTEVFTTIGVMAVGGGAGVLLIWLLRNWVAFCNWKESVDAMLRHQREAMDRYGTQDSVYRNLFGRMSELEEKTKGLYERSGEYDGRLRKLETDE